MTPEEAGQIILEGKPFIPCINCDGKGKYPIGVGSRDVTCSSCHGCKVQLQYEYIIACNVLGLEEPCPQKKPGRSS